MPSVSYWLVKSGLHRAISVLPRRQFWNALFQQYGTRSLSMSADRVATALGHCRRHLDALFAHAPHPLEDFTTVEVGTGWYPIQPIGMALCGASRVWTYDIEPLLNRSRLRVTLENLAQLAGEGRLAVLLPRLRPDRLATLEEALKVVDRLTPAETLKRLRIEAHVGDARRTGLPDASVDFFFSYSVLQYIPRETLAELLGEFRRVAKPTAVQSHNIYPGDQFYCFDRRLSPVNFLRYTSRQWRWLDSPLIPQTRLRISEYRETIRDAGWRIVYEDNLSADPAELRRFRLAPEFARFTEADLLTICTWLAAVPARESSA